MMACGVRLSLYGMFMRFVGDPVTIAIGAFAMGLKSNNFRIAIVQAEQCEAINRFTCYYILLFFTFHFTSVVDPYDMTFRFLGGEVIAKAVVVSP
ncbi:hypothetical protein CASFOL_003592 [Castilleja foliolosa]|uniref:Uncharacterized protein n=1 Tax=Castilleja foliolosa TaxID=1961234 RepID=A0ABD3EI91_9LAMI